MPPKQLHGARRARGLRELRTPGSARLRRLLGASSREGAERALRAFLRSGQLPTPAYDHVLAGRHRDAVWLGHRVVLEVDGFAAHGTSRAFHADRRRDQAPAAAGSLPLRATWPQLTGEPVALVARLAGALAHAEARREA